ncbi:MAG: hypothetical protein CBD27_08950 [Rhodospirillaceae bacterium TMED167]|nr:MAG: hypothetical protein CBD27_08950 [Rhodospirillaceae bacterium TMED167]
MPKQQLSNYCVAEITDTRIILVDRDEGRSVTNDAERVVRQLDESIRGGIGHRKVYYRDTDGRFDELITEGGRFVRFSPCTEGQQHQLSAALGTVSL